MFRFSVVSSRSRASIFLIEPVRRFRSPWQSYQKANLTSNLHLRPGRNIKFAFRFHSSIRLQLLLGQGPSLPSQKPYNPNFPVQAHVRNITHARLIFEQRKYSFRRVIFLEINRLNRSGYFIYH